MRFPTLFTLAVAAAIPGFLNAITVIQYTAQVNDRFSSGWSTAPVANTSSSFVGLNYDWSGVGWDAGTLNRNIAMISSQYFVFAHHYQPGSTINFLSPTLGTVVSYTWTPADNSTRFQFSYPSNPLGQAGDFAIGKLSNPLNPAQGIATYPILDLPTLAAYTGLPLFTYGLGDAGGGLGSSSPRIGTDTIGGFAALDLYPLYTGDTVADTFSVYHTDHNQPGNTRYQSGDSSGPLFVPWNGKLAIIGTHSAIDTIAGVFYNFDNFIPAYFSQMSDKGIDFTTVPETGAFAAVAGLGLIGFAAWRRATRWT